ncbi:conserved hypothetical protein [Candidatus Desulfosporosinus infrequens]|uniref:DnaJ homologue subfamily C member 28 conserved domain-containing protein n=1 Tax=Candidatus Desulfosporosinus infrequens TaxID=2043169 RepID=A0A2U3LRJ1_9FIRM|nr:conserved hypothetical protein [Candidatus Desulfosporosinus infrequens]
MFSIFDTIIEDRIQEAFRNGEFDNLPSQGKPINLDYWASLPEGIRVGYMLLMNNGFLPPEVQQLKDIDDLRERLACCTNQVEKAALKKTLDEAKMSYDLTMELRKKHKNCYR